MQRTQAEIEASRVRRREYMRAYMVAYRQTTRGQQVTRAAQQRWLMKQAAKLQAQQQEHGAAYDGIGDSDGGT